MALLAVTVAVWALVLGLSPGVALIFLALAVMLIGRVDGDLAARLLGRE